MYRLVFFLVLGVSTGRRVLNSPKGNAQDVEDGIKGLSSILVMSNPDAAARVVTSPAAPALKQRGQPSSRAMVERLRGGGPVKTYAGVPPLTRAWFTAAFILAFAIHNGHLQKEHLTYSPDALKSHEYWRVLTALFFTKEVGGALLGSLAGIHSVGGKLEKHYGTKAFLRDLMVANIMLTTVFHKKGWDMPGEAIMPAMKTMAALIEPNKEVNTWGFTFKSKYLPIVDLMCTSFFSQKWPVKPAIGTAVGYCSHMLRQLFYPKKEAPAKGKSRR